MPVSSVRGSNCVRVGVWFGLMLLVAACAVSNSNTPGRVALLAPFEGRYREVGYNALYAARLALADDTVGRLELLAVDDGGSVESAIDRAYALVEDPQIRAVVVLGYDASNEAVQMALGDLPTIVVGHWSASPQRSGTFMLASELLHELIPSPPFGVTESTRRDGGVLGGEALALQQFRALRSDLEDVRIATSASLPDDAFRDRYMASDPFAPPPGLLATLTYDAFSLVIDATDSDDIGRDDLRERISRIDYRGLNGTIHFEDGYWAAAPLHYFDYNADGQLIPIERVVE